MPSGYDINLIFIFFFVSSNISHGYIFNWIFWVNENYFQNDRMKLNSMKKISQKNQITIVMIVPYRIMCVQHIMMYAWSVLFCRIFGWETTRSLRESVKQYVNRNVCVCVLFASSKLNKNRMRERDREREREREMRGREKSACNRMREENFVCKKFWIWEKKKKFRRRICNTSMARTFAFYTHIDASTALNGNAFHCSFK